MQPKLTKPQEEELERLRTGPQRRYGKARARVQNALVKLGLAHYSEDDEECRLGPAPSRVRAPAEPVSGVETFGSVRRRLADAQESLLRELGEPHLTDAELHRRAQAGLLPETDRALDWYAAYAAYEDWMSEADLGHHVTRTPLDGLRRRWERKLVEITSLKARLRLLEPDGPDDFVRADGECECPACGLPYREHAEHPLGPTFMVLCDGRVVKT